MFLEAVRALKFVHPFIRTSFSDSCRDAEVFYSGCAILFLAGFAQTIDLSLLDNVPPRHLLDTCDWLPSHCSSRRPLPIWSEIYHTMPSTSTGFAATALHDGVFGPPDLVLCSADDFLFHVHRELLHDASSNAFGGLLGSTVATDAVLRVSEQSTPLCVILHAVYNMVFPTATQEQPTLETIFSAASRMRAFGLVPARLIVQSSALHSLLLSYAPQHALDVYTFAGNHDIEDLAIPVSEFLLSLDPGSIPDQIADGMNANYLKRLLLLQVSRINDMKEILKPLPAYHVSDSCKFPSSKTWRFAAGSTALWATPDMSVTSLVSSMKKHANYGDIPCDKCKENFDKNVSKAATRWSQAKATI